jgi:hypothetical protein
MNVLLIGDIVGSDATAYVARRLPSLRTRYAIDFVIANAENCAPTGLGMTRAHVACLFASGADLLTSGNHAWDGPEAAAVLGTPRVLRPHNMPAGVAGTGVWTGMLGDATLTVVNLGDLAALNPASTPTMPAPPLPVYPVWKELARHGMVIVDFHAEHVIAKQTFAQAVDGEAIAVLGTHTHEATLPLHRLPLGTVLVTEVGMSGPLGGVQGFDPRALVAHMKGERDLAAGDFVPMRGPIVLNAVLLEIVGGRVVHVARLIDQADQTTWLDLPAAA